MGKREGGRSLLYIPRSFSQHFLLFFFFFFFDLGSPVNLGFICLWRKTELFIGFLSRINDLVWDIVEKVSVVLHHLINETAGINSSLAMRSTGCGKCAPLLRAAAAGTAGTAGTAQGRHVWCRYSGYGAGMVGTVQVWLGHGGFNAGMVDTRDAHPTPVGTFAELPCIVPARLQPAPGTLDGLEASRRRMLAAAPGQRLNHVLPPRCTASISIAHPRLSSPGPAPGSNPTDEWAKPCRGGRRSA